MRGTSIAVTRNPNSAPGPAMTLRIHLCIMQPEGYIHSQGFLDQARYARHQFRRLGAEVTIGKNRLREDAVNIVFGAHLGFSAPLTERYTCIFLNLEQLGEGGARVSPDYLALLRETHAIDYDARNLPAYGRDPSKVPIVSFGWAPYLATSPATPIENRSIDLLFFGSVNERRRSMLARIEACGWNVSMFDHPLYAEERDQFIRQSKAVFNCHFYETSRFEQARAFHTLSLGTPLISERTAQTLPPPAFEEAVTWVTEDTLESFFREQFMSPQWLAQAQAQLQAFTTTDSHAQWELAFGYCEALWHHTETARQQSVWQPRSMNLGPAKDYRLGWLNVDVLGREQADLTIDMGQPIALPFQAKTVSGGRVRLEAGSLDIIRAQNVLEYVPDLNRLMTNLLALLREDGELEIEVACENAGSSWKDPASLRTLDKASWLNFTQSFWDAGWIDYRFELTELGWLDAMRKPCAEGEAASMTATLKKVSTTPQERAIARTIHADFGEIPPDRVECSTPSQVDATPGVRPNTPVVSVTQLAQDSQELAPDLDWLETLPPHKKVLSLGAEAQRLRTHFLERYPDASWFACPENNFARAAASAPYDLVVISPSDAAAPSLASRLHELQRLLEPGAVMSLALRNASAENFISKLQFCDTTRDISRDSDLSGRESPAHVYKTLLDMGWSPSMAGYRSVPVPQQAQPLPALPQRVSDLVTRMDCFFIEARRELQDLERSPGDALFTVVVPCTQELQLKTNVQASAGLKEVRARVVDVRDAESPAQAVAESLPHVDTEWLLVTHQDVYFPKGFGEHLNAVLQQIPPAERATSLIGFAGIGIDLQTQQSGPAGYLIDRLRRFDQPEASAATSLDEFAVVFHRDSVHAIDPVLGWHLWATDLCLVSIKEYNTFPKILRIPVFHNSRSGWRLPPAFYDSAEVLLRKHSEFSVIPTLCGQINAEFLEGQVAA